MPDKSKNNLNSTGIVIYKSPEGKTELQVNLKGDTVWLTPNQMSTLFKKARPTILEHIKNVYSEAELDSSSTCRKFRHVQNIIMFNKNNVLFLYILIFKTSIQAILNSSFKIRTPNYRLIFSSSTVAKFALIQYKRI